MNQTNKPRDAGDEETCDKRPAASRGVKQDQLQGQPVTNSKSKQLRDNETHAAKITQIMKTKHFHL